MKSTLLAALSLPVAMALSPASAQEQLSAVSPALEKYAQGPMAELWRRSGLAPRDRSLITVAALIAGNQGVALSGQIGLALDNGVKPREISETLTHLAFYSGWGNVTGAAAAIQSAFVQRGIGKDQLPPATPPSPLKLDEAAEAQRAQNVEAQFGSVSPGVVQFTTDVLFRDLWLRPDLAPRERSLVTVSALVAAGQVAQIPYHLNRAMDNGLTAEEAGEMLTQLAFYAGWPRVFSALPVVKDVIGKRPR